MNDNTTDLNMDDFPVSVGDLTALHARLEIGAVQQGLLDVGYRTVDTPIGTLLLAATDTGLVRVAFENEGFDAVLEDMADKVGPRILRVPAMLDDAAAQLDEYFDGRRQEFGLVLDHRLSSGFREQVQRYLPRIGYGQTTTYKQLAQRVGNPAAIRAVGSACATNPLPVVVPCHRVLRTDGTLGGYLGGLEVKSALLALESAA